MSSAAVAGFCGRCGAPYTADTGPFCGRCGNPIVQAPPVATGYTYPVVAAPAVPGMRQKLASHTLWLVAGGAVAVIAIVVTVIVVLVAPSSNACHFSCRHPQVGTPLVSATVYQNQQFHYVVEYQAPTTVDGHPRGMAVGNQTSSGMTLTDQDGTGSEAVFSASSGGDAASAVQTAVSGLDTNVFQDLSPNGNVRGAEIGLVPGQGQAYTANFLPPGQGGQATPVGVVVMAATHDNVTITVVVYSPYAKDVSVQPYGLVDGGEFDFPVTLTHFP